MDLNGCARCRCAVVGADGTADLNGDNIVGAEDLAIMLSMWG